MTYKIIQGDAYEVLKTLETESVDFTMTSPPYYGLRDYQVEGQIGLEKSFEEYLDRLMAVFSEVKRITKKTGSCYVNIGDTYASSGGPARHYGYADKKCPEHRRGDFIEPQAFDQGVPAKSLIGIPERFYLRMLDMSWICRNKIIWYKPNHLPSSFKDRLANSYEFLYHFVKSQRYFYDLDKIREPPSNSAKTQSFNYRVRNLKKNRMKSPEIRIHGDGSELEKYDKQGVRKAQKIDPKLKWDAHKNDKDYARWYFTERKKTSLVNHDGRLMKGRNEWNGGLVHPFGKAPDDVWRIPTKGHSFEHYAVFPLNLVYRPMISSSPPHGTVLDPFCGSGTVLLMAELLMRKSIGIELSKKYIEITEMRLKRQQNEVDILAKILLPKIEEAGAMDRFVGCETFPRTHISAYGTSQELEEMFIERNMKIEDFIEEPVEIRTR